MDEFRLLLAPSVDDAEMQQCRESNNFCPVLFKWYQHVSALCFFFASLHPDSSCIRAISPLHYSVLIGLLNRCARLMRANVYLSHEGKFGEATLILDRCIFESSIKLSWICTDDAERINRFVLDGLKSDVTLKREILSNVAERGGQKLVIEERMLQSIDGLLKTVSTTEADVDACKKLHPLNSMINDIGHDRIMYIVGQKMGSHHVHGTWPALVSHYLEERDGLLGPRGDDWVTHENQYILGMRSVLSAMYSFAEFAVKAGEDRQALTTVLDDTSREIKRLNDEIVGQDFDRFRLD